MTHDPERLPVIVGVGEITQRTKAPDVALEPLGLMVRALHAADIDAKSQGGLLSRLDSLDMVCEYSWPYGEPVAWLCRAMGLAPQRAVYGEVGGESPVRFIHEAALRIARGESRWSAVVGAEAQYAVSSAQKSGATLPWTPRDDSVKLVRGPDFLHPLAVAHGVATPAHVYPFYENAALVAWQQTPDEAHAESAELWSRFSAVAAANPYAWLRRSQSPAEVATPTPDNRLIAWPYTKAMVANPNVNMGAAVLLTSQAEARRAGIPDAHMIHVWGGAAAREPRDYLMREGYTASRAQEAVLQQCLRMAEGNAACFALAELYSCFPIVPKMARRTLGLPPDAAMSATGGLSFFGAPLNNYMTHAACALVRGLRGLPDKLALLYGQGEYLTKHHALVLGRHPSPSHRLSASYEIQPPPGSIPALVQDHAGPAALETFTVLHGRSGEARGVVICRTPQGARLMAAVPPGDQPALDWLTRGERSPIGHTGMVRADGHGLLAWTPDGLSK